MAVNAYTGENIVAKTYQMALPLLGGSLKMAGNGTGASRIVESVFDEEMMNDYELRSTVADDPWYSNVNVLHPYYNCRVPVRVFTNALAAYGLSARCFQDEALDLAGRLLTVLADDMKGGGRLALGVLVGRWDAARCGISFLERAVC